MYILVCVWEGGGPQGVGGEPGAMGGWIGGYGWVVHRCVRLCGYAFR